MSLCGLYIMDPRVCCSLSVCICMALCNFMYVRSSCVYSVCVSSLWYTFVYASLELQSSIYSWACLACVLYIDIWMGVSALCVYVILPVWVTLYPCVLLCVFVCL